eukprot:scaffold17277_cov33-Tisochrysis_lutea.AAC.1
MLHPEGSEWSGGVAALCWFNWLPVAPLAARAVDYHCMFNSEVGSRVKNRSGRMRRPRIRLRNRGGPRGSDALISPICVGSECDKQAIFMAIAKDSRYAPLAAYVGRLRATRPPAIAGACAKRGCRRSI